MQFSILGPLEAREGGRSIDLGAPKQRALLAVLLVHAGEVVPTDRLADLLWDGTPPARAEVSLRSYAANLRRALEPDRPRGAGPALLVTDRGGYRMVVGDEELDARRFERAVAEARGAAAAGRLEAASAALDECLSWWRGPALADVVSVPVVAAEAARLEELRMAAVEDRLELELERGRHAGAVADLERLVVSHPSRERLRGLLMIALHRCGRTAEALAAYRAFKERLADELGLDPSPALRSLEEVIRRGEDPGVAPRAAAGGHGDGSDDRLPPILGREAEVDRLMSIATAALAGRGRIVTVGGEAGAGKTRLVAELASRVEADATVVWARCFDAVDAPAFWPWSQVISAVATAMGDGFEALIDSRTAGAAALVPGAAPPGPSAARPADGAPFQRYDAVATLLTRAAAHRPLVVVLDDLQWADVASARLVHFLGSVVAGHPLLVVATYRTGDVDEPALTEVLADLVRVPSCVRIELDGLDRESIAGLMARVAGDEVPSEAAVDAVFERSAGNPFVATEIVRLSPDGASGLPSGVRDVIRARVARLGERATALLTLAAVAGRDADVALLEAVDGGDDVLDVMESAVAANLVEERADHPGRYRFAHAIAADALTSSLSAMRRARIHARIAAALDAGGTPRDEGRLLELTRHCLAAAPLDADLARRGVELARAAASLAMDRLAYEEAAEHCRQALDAMAAGRLHDDATRARVLVDLGAAVRAAGDPAGSRAACLEAAAAATSAGDPEALADAALGLALPGAVIGMDFGVVDEQRVALLEESLRRLPPGDSAVRVRVLVHLALALQLSVDSRRRAATAAEALAMADRLGDPGLRAAALAARHSTLWGPRPIDERLGAARDLVAFAEQAGAHQTALEGRIALAIDLLEAADLDGFRREVALVDQRVRVVRQPFYEWYSRVLDATRASMEGRYADAEQLADAARIAGGVALGRRALWGQIGWHFVTAWDAGGISVVEGPLRALTSAFPDATVTTGALALVLVETDRPAEALHLTRELLENPTAVPEDAMWSFTLALLAELAFAIGDVAAARRVHEALAPAAGRLVVVGSGVACCGAVDRSLGLLAVTFGDSAAAAAHLEAALELNDAVGARPWSLRTRGAIAANLLRRAAPGDSERAARLLEEATSGAVRLGAHGLRRWLDGLGR